MYKTTTSYVNSQSTDITSYIDGNDHFNSELLYKIDKCKNLKNYKVTKFEKRVDLISNDIYNTEEYQWLILYLNKISIDEIVRGVILKYIPLDSLKSIINTI
jgi:hypothetical protein